MIQVIHVDALRERRDRLPGLAHPGDARRLLARLRPLADDVKNAGIFQRVGIKRERGVQVVEKQVVNALVSIADGFQYRLLRVLSEYAHASHRKGC